MSNDMHLLKRIDFNVNEDEFIFKKVFNKNPSFQLKDKKIISLFPINEDNSNELVRDSVTWDNLLKNINWDDFNERELAIINNIDEEISDKDMVIYEMF